MPPGPRELPALQTARWLMRPLAFLDSCRRRFGDTFTVRLAAHRTPLVIISDPVEILADARRGQLLPPLWPSGGVSFADAAAEWLR